MCGLSAIIAAKNNPSLMNNIVNMTNQIRHRGPDGEGYLFYSSRTEDLIITGGPDTPPEVYCADLNYLPKKCHLDSLLFEANIALGHRRLAIVDLSVTGHQPMCDKSERYWIRRASRKNTIRQHTP